MLPDEAVTGAVLRLQAVVFGAGEVPCLTTFAWHLSEQDHPDGAVGVGVVGEVGLAPWLDGHRAATWWESLNEGGG